MIVIICAKQKKNPSRTVDATEQTWFSKSRPNDLEDIGQGQVSSHATKPLMLLIICTQYGKNPSWTVDAIGWTGKVNGHTVVLIKFLPYSGATAQTRSVALWGVSGSYGQAPAQQGMSGLVRETSHLCLYSSPSPSLQPILREPATSILSVLYTF